MMGINDNEIIAYLAEHYSSAIAKRALWTCGGGVETDIDYDLSPLDGWGLMWALAEESVAPTRIGLVREMLFDSPGEETLLGYLDELAAERFKAEKDVADFFLFLLVRNGAAENRLAALLYLLQDIPPACILAATAPTIQAARDDKLYDDLEKILPKFNSRCVTLSTGVLVEWIEFYLERLTEDVSVAPVTLKTVGRIKELLAVLQALVTDATEAEDVEAPEEKLSAVTTIDDATDDKDKAKAKLEERKSAFEETTLKLNDQIEGLEALLSETGAGFFRPAVTVVAALLDFLKKTGLEGEKVSLRLSAVEAVRAALWATR